MSDEDDMLPDSIWELFEEESETYLEVIESHLGRSAEDLADPEAMSALFRSFHSLKGISATLGLTGIETVAHKGEDLLDLYRSRAARPDADAVALLLRAFDAMSAMRDDALADHADVACDPALVTDLVALRERLTGAGDAGGAGRAGGVGAGAPRRAAKMASPGDGDIEDDEDNPLDRLLEEDTDLEEGTDFEADKGLDDEEDDLPDFVEDEDDLPPIVAVAPGIQVSNAPADPSEKRFSSDVVGAFQAVVIEELEPLAAALDRPALAALDGSAVAAPLRSILVAAESAGFAGIAGVVARMIDGLADSAARGGDPDRTALTRDLCGLILRLRILAELGRSPFAIERVTDALSPHISKQARDVLDRLESDPGVADDWELVSVYARALGVPRLSALARLASELTVQDDWRGRTDAAQIVEAIRTESMVIGVEGLDVSSLDMEAGVYESTREQIARLLTDADPAEGALAEVLGEGVVDGLSPQSRKEIADALAAPGGSILALRVMLPDDALSTPGLLARVLEENVLSNRIRGDIDPDLCEFLVRHDGSPASLLAELRAIGGDGAIHSCKILTGGADGAIAETDAPEPARSPSPRSQPSDSQPAEVRTVVAAGTSNGGVPATSGGQQLVPTERRETTPRPASAEGSSARPTGTTFLRVSPELVDIYLDTVAELRLSLSRLEQGADDAGFSGTSAELRNIAAKVGSKEAERLRAAAHKIDAAGKVIASQIARAETTLRQLHGVTLDLRVVPIGLVLNRLPRMVRDLSQQLGKRVDLDLDDGDVRIDKSMVDALMEPLMHMVRNAMDHGIEPPGERAAIGKPEVARLRLIARQAGHMATIRIEDDGRGLNTARIRAKAIERGLITENQASTMPEREIHRQILAPGFSTAQAITATSGRGVGMDVVQVTVRRLGGSIDIVSNEGSGTTFTLSFPVSATLQRIVVLSDGAHDLGLPERSIVEVIESKRSALQTVGRRTGIEHRDGFLPVRPIESILGWPEHVADGRRPDAPIVVIANDRNRVGVLVDSVRRRQEVFMKELHPALTSIDVLAGATVMGEGEPLLILDPEALIAIVGA